MGDDWTSLVSSAKALDWRRYSGIVSDNVFAGGGTGGTVDVSTVPVLAALAATKLQWSASPMPAALLSPPPGVDVKGYNKLAVEVRLTWGWGGGRGIAAHLSCLLDPVNGTLRAADIAARVVMCDTAPPATVTLG
jgi:hypothetical protein